MLASISGQDRLPFDNIKRKQAVRDVCKSPAKKLSHFENRVISRQRYEQHKHSTLR